MARIDFEISGREVPTLGGYLLSTKFVFRPSAWWTLGSTRFSSRLSAELSP